MHEPPSRNAPSTYRESSVLASLCFFVMAGLTLCLRNEVEDVLFNDPSGVRTFLSRSAGEKPFKSMHNKRILQTCTPSCTACDSNQLCTSCATGYILSPASTCETLCRQREYLLGGTGTCQQCDNQCRNCWGQANNCTECYYGLKTYQYQATPPLFKCIPTCKSNEWYSYANNSCVQCPYLCTQCTSQVRCTQCLATVATLVGTKCEIVCPTGTFRDSNNICQNCDAWCGTCSGSSSNCLTCAESGPTINAVPDCKSSSNPCARGFYWSGSACVPCSDYPRCQTCSGLNICTSCRNTGLLTSTGGFVENAVFLQSTYCSFSPYRCIEVTTSGVCTKCIPGYSGANCDQVTLTCPTKTYPSVNNDVCIPCNDNCGECGLDYGQVNQRYKSGSYPCTLCTSPYSGGGANPCIQPFTDCKVNQYVIGSGCGDCDPSCRTCFGSANTCTSCYPGKYLAGTICMTAVSSFCADNQSLNYGFCLPCDGGCKRCYAVLINNNPSSQCVECTSGLSLILETNFCGGCHATCATCNGVGINNCLTCLSNAELATNGSCVCKQGYYFTAPNICSPCDPTCKTCAEFSSNKCLSCLAGYTVATPAPSNCVPTGCTSSQYFISLGNCGSCDPTCLTCEGGLSTDCLTCSSDKILEGSSCKPIPVPVVPCSTPNIFMQNICLSPKAAVLSFDEQKITFNLSLGYQNLTCPSDLRLPTDMFSASLKSNDSTLPLQITSVTFNNLQDRNTVVITVKLSEETSYVGEASVKQMREPTQVTFWGSSLYTVASGSWTTTMRVIAVPKQAPSILEASLNTVSNSMQQAVGPAAAAALFVASPASASAGTLLQKMANFFEFLQYLNGRRLVYPDKILKAVGISLIPLDFDNYLEVDEQEVNCTPSPNYADNDVSCNILNNFGKDILFMGFVLLITLFILLLKRVVTVVIKNPNNLFRRLVTVLDKHFGLGYFLLVFEGYNCDTVGTALLHLGSSTRHIWGTTVAISLLSSVFGFSIGTWLFVREFLRTSEPDRRQCLACHNQTNKKVSEGSETKITVAVVAPQVLETQLQDTCQRIEILQKQCSLYMFKFTIANFDPRIRSCWYFWCLVSILRNLLVHLLLVTLSSQDMVQVVGVFIVQLLYTLALILARPQLSLLDNIVTIVTAVLFTVYILLVWIVNQGIEERVAQELYGLIMAGVLVSIVAVNFIFIAYSVIRSLYLAIKMAWSVFRNGGVISPSVPGHTNQGPINGELEKPNRQQISINQENSYQGDSTFEQLQSIKPRRNEKKLMSEGVPRLLSSKREIKARNQPRTINSVQQSQKVPTLLELGQRANPSMFTQQSSELRTETTKASIKKDTYKHPGESGLQLKQRNPVKPISEDLGDSLASDKLLRRVDRVSRLQDSDTSQHSKSTMRETDAWAKSLISKMTGKSQQ